MIIQLVPKSENSFETKLTKMTHAAQSCSYLQCTQIGPFELDECFYIFLDYYLGLLQIDINILKTGGPFIRAVVQWCCK